MRFHLQGINYPTPVKVKHLADSILGALASTGIAQMASGNTKLGATIAITGFICKMISNFFSDY